MTEERMALIELVEKQADGDLLREMLAFAAERIMEAEVEARTGATKGAARRRGRFSATATEAGTGTPGRGGLRWRSRSCATATISRASWSFAGRLRKRSSR